MKQWNAAILCLALAVVMWAGVNFCRVRIEAIAQDPPPGENRDLSGNETAKKTNKRPSDRPFPVFFIDEVLVKLTAAGEELIEKNQVKNSDELRQDISRTEFATKLLEPSVKTVSSPDLYRRLSESVFLVAGLTKPNEKENNWQTAFSTAFVIHEDGILSTSAHVFDHEDHDDAVVVMDVNGKAHPVVEILATDLKADTCLFRIGTKGLKPLPLGKDAAPGTPIRIMGHPGDSFFFFSSGVIANYERDDAGLEWLNVTADFGQGSSGGPVLDDFGNVVGQVSRTYTLYAGGTTSQRRKRPRTTRQAAAADPAKPPIADAAENDSDPRKPADPQMIFKACTPVSAIRSLVK